MAYVDFPPDLQGQKKRKAFWTGPDGCLLVQGWRRQGTPLTKIIKEYIGVSNTAFFGWYRSPEGENLRKAAANSRELANMSVEEALFKRATGYDYWEEVWELVEGQVIMTKKYKKHLPPDTKAILHWLFNKLPDQWRSVQEPLEQSKYTETIKSVLVAMKEVAENGGSKEVEVKEEPVE